MTQTNKLPKIKIFGANGKKTYIPLTHNVYATQKVGRIVPYMVRFMDANGKSKINLETLEYNSPMLSPTVGDIRLKHWLYFVGLDKLCPELANMLAKQTAVKYDGSEFMITEVPHMKLCWLTALCMIGAFCTVYISEKYAGSVIAIDDGEPWLMPSSSSKRTTVESAIETALSSNWIKNVIPTGEEYKTVFGKTSAGLLGGMNAYCLNLKYLLVQNGAIDTQYAYTNYIQIPLANPTSGSFYDWRLNNTTFSPAYDGKHNDYTHGIDCSPVSLASADYVVRRGFTRTIDGVEHEMTLTFAFRFSDFGRALRDVLIASGLQLDLASNKEVSLLPFFANYLAYFEAQSLQLFKNWQNTAAYKLLCRFRMANAANFNVVMEKLHTNDSDAQLFIEFVNDLASMWAIEPQDFVSSHTRKPITSPLVFNSLDSFVNGVSSGVSGQTNPASVPISETASQTESSVVDSNNLPYIDQINHDVVVAELLKRVTLRMTVNSMYGRKIPELLRENGFGEWLNLQKANFIDYGEMTLDLKPVVSTADTSSDGKGADLGQYGGRGYGHKYHKSKSFTNKVPGYYVLMTAVTVDSGYCQAIDPYNFCVGVDDFYKREFDSIGYEVNEKNVVHGSLTWVEDGDAGKLDESFGFAPRSMKFKQIANKLLGGFTDGELSDVYDTYQLEKMLPVGRCAVEETKVTNAIGSEPWTRTQLGSRFAPADLPIAGNIWRFIGRVPWLGLYDRIFKLQDYDLRKVQGVFGITGANVFEQVTKIFSYFMQSPENYTVLNTIHFDSWQDKEPISESFGTLSEIFSGLSNGATHKE